MHSRSVKKRWISAGKVAASLARLLAIGGCPCHRQIEQLRHRFQIPVRVVGDWYGPDRSSAGSSRAPGLCRCDTSRSSSAPRRCGEDRGCAVPGHAGSNADARRKPDPLAGLREVVAGATVGQPCSLAGDEQRIGGCARAAGRARQHSRRAAPPRVGSSGSSRSLPSFPRRTRSTPFSPSRSSGSSASASLILRPVTAMSPNKVEQVSPRRP